MTARTAPLLAAARRADSAPETIRLDQPPALVAVRRSARARRFTLTVGRIDGAPVLTLPARASLDEGRAFVERHAAWLAGALARAPQPTRVQAGAPLPVGGRMLELASLGRPRAAAREEEGRLWVPGTPAEAPARAEAYLKEKARAALVPAAHRYAQMLGRSPSRITLRDTRSRWGSCAANGALSFSWRLAMAPPEVLEYVAAHEAAHLVEMNHGPQFWAQVERIFPGWQAQRDWLRERGAELHRWRFEPQD